jgi:hypothetical protein
MVGAPRRFGPKFMRQSFDEYAGESGKHSFWARACYEQQIAKGKMPGSSESASL